MGSSWRGGLRRAEFFLIELDSFSLADLVGDLECELVGGSDGGRSVVRSRSLGSVEVVVLCFFFGEVLEKKVGRTMGDNGEGSFRVALPNSGRLCEGGERMTE